MNTKPANQVADDASPDTPGGALGRLVMVREDEGTAVMLAAGYFFFLLLSYNMLSPVREAMGIKGSWEYLPWLITGTMVVMALVNPLFSWMASRLPRRLFIPRMYRFAALNLVAFYILFQMVPAGALWLGYAFFIWLSVFNLFILSVFWGFVADTFGAERARRVFGVVAVGGTLGALLGASLTGLLVGGFRVGPWPNQTVSVAPTTMLLLAVVPLELAVQCMKSLAREFGLSEGGAGRLASSGHAEPGPGAWEGLRLIAASPYLQLIAVYILLYATTSTLLYLEQGKIVKDFFATDALKTAAFARMNIWTQSLTLVVQIFLTGRLVRWLGVRGTLAFVPVLTAAGFVALRISPTFAVLATVQVLRKGLHYAVDKPSREMLYTVLGADAKYKSKPFIDTFVYRGGDLLGAWLPGVLKAAGGTAIAMIAVPAALVWAVTGMTLGVWQRKAAEAARSAAGGS